VKNSGIQFAFAKATEGVNFVDSRFTANMAGATAAGVMIGPYHFCRVDSLNGVPFTSYDGLPFQPGTGPYIDAVSEAQDFLDAIMPYYQTNQYLPPVADVESLPNFGSSTLNRLFISNWVQLFSDTINSTLGVRPLIYTNLSHANSVYEPDVAATHDLWLAWWKGTGTSNPPVPSDTPAWPKYKFWQWTNASSVPGISGNVDGDVFNGTLAQLQQLLIGPASTPVTPFANKVNITDFESGEGYFNWSTSASGSNQGILAGSAADRVTTEAHDGDGSQRINIVGNAGGWFLRHLSGIGSPPASPDTNLTLDAEGYLGFWLKTTNPGITVQLALDDPGSAIDRGLAQNVIADGRWHLYEWDLGDDSQWQAWTSLADGTIGGATVTIDSIQFTGAGNAVIYLDSVAHNPNGSLLPDPGDFDYDGDVDNDDLTAWEAGYGTSSGASMDSGDADGDGDVDGADYLAFQSHFTGSLPLAAAAAAVPEPVSTGLVLVGLLALSAARLSR
jgi:GH25 family lysozyme M1 (1,4-beta-N-acetylmuramidase)